MLLDVLDEHRGAFEYDWRTRFGLAVDDLPESMGWGEASRQLEVLLTDTTSRVGAAVAGWSYPVDRMTLVAMDMYDLQHRIAFAQGGGKGRKPKPYPRPWPELTKSTTKPAADITQDQIVAALRFAGHTAPMPSAN